MTSTNPTDSSTTTDKVLAIMKQSQDKTNAIILCIAILAKEIDDINSRREQKKQN